VIVTFKTKWFSIFVLIFSLILNVSIVSASSQNLTLFSPKNDLSSTKDTVLFKGKVTKDTVVFLNDAPLILDDNGKFYVKQKLTQPSETFIIKAINSSGDETLLNRTIYFDTNKNSEVKNSLIKSLPAEPPSVKPLPATYIPITPSRQETPLPITSSIPKIVVASPENNFVTYKDSISIKGSVTNAEEFYINNKRIPLDQDGLFNEPFPLDDIGKHVFNLNALGDHNLNTSLIRKVFKVAPKTTEGNSKETLDINPLQKIISLNLSGADIKEVLDILASKGDMNIVSDQSLTGEVNVSLENVTLISAIDLILTTQGVTYKIIDNTIIVSNSQNLQSPSRLETKIFKVNNIDPINIVPVIEKYLAQNESVETIGVDNTLVVHASPRKINSIAAIISELDSQGTPQVLIEAYIFEVTKSSLDNLGVAWSSNYGVGFTSGATQDGSQYTVGFSMQTVINMLESSGQAKVLAKPRLKAIHKEEAEIFIGDEMPYIQLTIDTAGRTTETVQYVNSGITLKIKPYINTTTGIIKIKVDPEVSYINGFTGSNNDIPIVRTRKVSTTVFVKDGNTVFIGGLFNSSDTDTNSRFPFLGSLPLIGKLFQTNRIQNDETELVIAITPKIIDIDSPEPFMQILANPTTTP
jgi:type IV pilus assembly protein PilQ